MDFALRALPPGYEPGSAALAASPDFLRNCLHTYVYILTTDDRAFWMYPTQVDPDFLHGYTWKPPIWSFARFDWRELENFH